ncbi:hypothetical protein ACFPN1_09055 [Lysobacter yangpyeongensis]|uniref:Uncharacterized protein n=1 Tax=Lysobacter yangpyeongensis TaxID=346182 RepID=A0ABW0SMI9_9GAMM
MKVLNRMSWAALAAFAVAFVVFVGGYSIGKDLAGRDNTQQHAN